MVGGRKRLKHEPVWHRHAGLTALALACALLSLVGCGAQSPTPAAENFVTAAAAPEALLQPSEANGCDPLTAEAFAGPEVLIEFGGDASEPYRPRCLMVAVGDAVKFVGDFGLHPLTGGAVLDGMAFPDRYNPLPQVNAGTEATFRADRVGAYPFYCRVHWPLGMSGVVYVR